MIGIQNPKSRRQSPASIVQRLARSPQFLGGAASNLTLPNMQASIAGLSQLSPQAFQQQPAGAPDLRFLLHHGTMGFSLVDYYEALPLGWDGWLSQQLSPGAIDDSAVESVIGQLPTLGLSPSQLLLGYPDEQVEQIVVELQIAALLRSIYSKRQLFERMVTFWTDHFNISQLDDLCLWLKTDDDREVVRRHAFGTFPDMLKASARSSAMLWYLDNYSNYVGAAQENYARELLELHTLGVDGPYTENDVREVARCFTGWTLGGINGMGQAGEFTFVPALHDFGVKTVLGITIPAGGGIEDGERVLNILANHPKTAEFIARKMCRWLLMYEPSIELVRSVGTVYMQTGGDLRLMMRAILDPDVVHGIPVEERTKLRQPLHFMIALMRATLVSSTDLLQLTFASQKFGQTPFWWPSPDGPPDSLEKWGGSVLPRWEFASRFFAGEIGGNAPQANILEILMRASPGATRAARINFVLTGGLIDAGDETEVHNYLQQAPLLNDVVIAEAFALAASSPSFQFI